MISVNIKNVASQQYTHGAQFETRELAQVWIDSQLTKGLSCPWGKPEHTVQVEVSPYIPAEFDEEGNEISPAVEAVYEDQVVPSEFTIEIEDISAQVAQEEININARKFLTESDWKVLRHRDQVDSGVITSLSEQEYQDLLVARQAARESIIE